RAPPRRGRSPAPSLPGDDPDEHFSARPTPPPKLQQIPVLLRGQFEDLGAHIASARGLDHVPGGAVRDHLVLDRQDAGDRADAVTDGGWWADDLDFDASRRKDLLDQAIDRPLGDDGALVDDDDATAHDRDFR